MNLGGAELLIIVAIAVMLFGAGWLPKAARNLGKAKVEFDEVQKQFNEAKDSVVEAAGVKEIEATVRKANKAFNTSPQKLMKDAAKSAVTGGGAGAAAKKASTKDAADEIAVDEDGIEDAEIVGPTDKISDKASGEDDDNVNVDFR
jgi:TatA/E family protein of Tat protein translocase